MKDIDTILPFSIPCDIRATYVTYRKLQRQKPDSTLFYSTTKHSLTGLLYQSAEILDSSERSKILDAIQAAQLDTAFHLDSLSGFYCQNQPEIKIQKYISTNDTLYSFLKYCVTWGDGHSVGNQLLVLFRITPLHQAIALYTHYANGYTNMNNYVWINWIADLNNDSILEIGLFSAGGFSVAELINGKLDKEVIWYSVLDESCSQAEPDIVQKLLKRQ